MNLHRFQQERSSDWARLQELIVAARGRPERLGAAEVRELGDRYRSVVADLARVRQYAPQDPLRQHVEALALQARQLVYDSEFRRVKPVRFLSTRYWQLIRSRPVPLATAAVLLLGVAVAVGLWALAEPEATVSLVPAQFRDALDPGPEGTANGLSPGDQTAFSAFLITNNIRVAIVAFAAGIFWTIGAGLVLVLNGIVLGAVGGLLVGAGDGSFFLELVAAHGVLELSVTIVAAAAGIRMGWALVDPGLETRRHALTAEAQRAVLILVGTMPWIMVAGIIEAFVSRNGFEAPLMVVIGVLVGAAYWGLVWLRGAPDSEPPGSPQTRASALASR